MSKPLVTPLYQPIDIIVSGASSVENPFFAELKGVFSGPGGRYQIPGFCDGDGVWKVRFSPTALGEWTYALSSPHIKLSSSGGKVTCTPNGNSNVHGGLVIDHDNPYHFFYEDGTPYFMFAYEADWLWALGLADPSQGQLRSLLAQIKQYGFNQVIVQLYANYATWCRRKDGSMADDYGPPAQCLWQGTHERPDHLHMNIAYWRNYDQMMQILLDEGITAHMFIKVYNKNVIWPERYSDGDDLLFKYLTARYQAFPNIIWDYSKETYYELDKEYVASRMALIRANDAYRRLSTVHDDRRYYAVPEHAGLVDFVTLQQHGEFYHSALYERSLRRWPVFNSEFGYESGPGGLDDYFAWGNNTVEEFVDRAWQIAMAGAYIGYYYNYTAWNIIDWSHIPPGYKLFRILHDFFTSLRWWEFAPRRDLVRNDRTLCLTRGDEEFVLYCGAGRAAELPIEVMPRQFTAAWLNTFSGKTSKAEGELTSESHFSEKRWVFKNPFDVPAALHVVRA